MRRIFIHRSLGIQISYISKALILNKGELVVDKEIDIISYVSKALILNKRELVLDKERKILSTKSRDYLSYNQGEIQV